MAIEFLQRAWSDVIRDPSLDLSYSILEELYSGKIDDEHAVFWIGNHEDLILTLYNSGKYEFSDQNDKILETKTCSIDEQKEVIKTFFAR